MFKLTEQLKLETQNCSKICETNELYIILLEIIKLMQSENIMKKKLSLRFAYYFIPFYKRQLYACGILILNGTACKAVLLKLKEFK